MAVNATSNCSGWSCAEVKCDDGYAVYIPKEDAYLPCNRFNEYIETKNKEILR